jgi:hypothetical protein
MLTLFLTVVFVLVGCSNAGTANSSKSVQGEIYENKKLGFTLELPASWKGNYIIHEYEDSIEVCFIGQSETSKGLLNGSNKVNGLTMFFIGNEDCIKKKEFLDGAQEIGESNGVKYYYFTGTDYAIGALMSDYIKGEQEKKLASDDLLIAKEMEKDINSILSTFK